MTYLPNPFLFNSVTPPSSAVTDTAGAHRPPVASAGSIPASTGGSQEALAAVAPNPHPVAGALDELQELLAYAHKRHRVFAPDEEAIMAVAYDESAPRAPDCDAVWRDEAPLFLRQAG